MALLIYMKGEQKAPLVLKGNMETLDKQLEDLNQPANDGGMNFETFTGNKIKFMSYNQWGYVIEEKDSVVKKQLEDMKKRQKEQQKAMDKAQGKNVIEPVGMQLLGRRGKGGH